MLSEYPATIDASFSNKYFDFLCNQGFRPEMDSEAAARYINYEGVRIYRGTDNLAIFLRTVNTLKFKFTDAKPEEVKRETFQKIIVKSKKEEEFHLVHKVPEEKEEGVNYITIEEYKEFKRIFDIIDSIVEG